MRNVGSPVPWLLRPSLQKNVAGLGLRQGVLPLPPGVGWGEGRTAQVSEDLVGRGFLVLLASLCFVVMGSSQGGPNPVCFLHQISCQAWIPRPGQTTYFCYLEMWGRAKIYLFIFLIF